MAENAILETTGPGGKTTEQVIPLETQAVRTTTGRYTDVPINRYDLHSTTDISAEMRFFDGDATGSRVDNNYGQNPPNNNEPTIITGLAIIIATPILKRDAANNIEPIDQVNALGEGVLQIRESGQDSILLEVPAGEFLDLSGLDASGDNVIVPQRAQIVKLQEVVKVTAGLRYDVIYKLAGGASVPTDAEWAASTVQRTRVRVRAEHRGQNGR